MAADVVGCHSSSASSLSSPSLVALFLKVQCKQTWCISRALCKLSCLWQYTFKEEFPIWSNLSVDWGLTIPACCPLPIILHVRTLVSHFKVLYQQKISMRNLFRFEALLGTRRNTDFLVWMWSTTLSPDFLITDPILYSHLIVKGELPLLPYLPDSFSRVVTSETQVKNSMNSTTQELSELTKTTAASLHSIESNKVEVLHLKTYSAMKMNQQSKAKLMGSKKIRQTLRKTMKKKTNPKTRKSQMQGVVNTFWEKNCKHELIWK